MATADEQDTQKVREIVAEIADAMEGGHTLPWQATDKASAFYIRVGGSTVWIDSQNGRHPFIVTIYNRAGNRVAGMQSRSWSSEDKGDDWERQLANIWRKANRQVNAVDETLSSIRDILRDPEKLKDDDIPF